MMKEDKAEKFKILSKRIKNCHKCKGLNIKGVTESAPGFGNIHSKVMMVGQSLCYKCMETQVPFTGGSGRVLDKAFEMAGIKKSDIFITNVVHCHPPENRPSLPEEIENCSGHLKLEIEIVNPKVIIPLGRDAVVSILGEEAWSSSVWKKVKDKKSRSVYPMYHPSYARRMGNKAVEKYVKYLTHILKEETK